jgi:hypothetical protein
VWRARNSRIGVLVFLTQAPLLIIIFWLITLPLGTGADADLDRVVDAGVLNTGADAALDRVVDAGVLNTGPRAPCSSFIA